MTPVMTAGAHRGVVVTRGLMAVLGVFWTVLGTGAATVAWPRLSRATPLAGPLVGLVLANAVVFFGLWRALRRPSRGILGAAGLWAALNLVLSFTDQVGPLDLVSAALALAATVTSTMAWRAA